MVETTAKALQKGLAEAIGTFALTLVGAGSIIVSTISGVNGGLVAIAFAHGLTLAIMVTATAAISGGHINPAVTLGFMVTKRISIKLGLLYWVFQVAGALIAGVALFALFPSALGTSVNYGTPAPSNGVTIPQAIILELIATFFLVMAVFGTLVDERAPRIGGFGIGLTVAFDILAIGPLTGAAMNPARAIGPAFLTSAIQYWYIYWVGPLIGGAIAALVYERVFIGSRRTRSANIG
jgi:aquaporin TIP